MLKKFVDTLRVELSILDYINDSALVTGVKIGAHNIGFLEPSETAIEGDNLILTVIRVEEESTLKNFPNQKLVNNGGSYEMDKRFPKIHLNYYILITSTMQYDMAVATIDRVVKFFQYHKKIEFESDGDEIVLNMELCSLSFEQLNNIWGMYGGKQLPSLIYKARVSSLEKEEEQLSPLITTIGGSSNHHE